MLICNVQEEEAAEGQDNTSESLESGWEDGEFLPLDDFPSNDSGKIVIVALIIEYYFAFYKPISFTFSYSQRD